MLGVLTLDTLGYDGGPAGVFWFDGETEIAVRLDPPRPGWLTGALFWHPVNRPDTLVLTVYGPAKETRPGAPLFSETLQVSGEGWAYFQLDTLRVVPRDGLWLSVKYILPQGETPAPVDSGPVVVRHGSFFKKGEVWEEAWRYGLDMSFNWILRGEFLSDSPGVDLVAERVALYPCSVPADSQGRQFAQKAIFKNYSDMAVTLWLKAFIYDSSGSLLGGDSQEVYLSRRGYAGSADTVEFALPVFGEGLYWVAAVVSHPSDTVPENDTAWKALYATYTPAFSFDTLTPEDWGWPSVGWKLYAGHESWSQWQESPIGLRSWAKDEGQASFFTNPIAVEPGAKVFFWAAAGPSFTGSGRRFFTIKEGADTFDLGGFQEREWSLLSFDLGLDRADTVQLVFWDDVDQEFYIDCLGFLGADTLLGIEENKPPRKPRPLELRGLSLFANERGVLRAFSADGRLVFKGFVEPGPVKLTLKPGVYFLRMKGQTLKLVRK